MSPRVQILTFICVLATILLQLQAFAPTRFSSWRRPTFLRSTKVMEPSTDRKIMDPSEGELGSNIFTPSPRIAEVTDNNFDNAVLASPNLSLVYFTSSWCKSPMESTLQRVIVDQQNNEDVQFFQMDTDENYHTVTDFNVRFIPSVGLFKDGVMVSEIVGLVSAAVINEQIEKYLSEEHQTLDDYDHYMQ